MQVNAATLQALFKGYRTQYLEAYQAGEAKWPQVAMRTGSVSAEEIYHWLGAFPGMEEYKGEFKVQNLTASKYAIPNLEYDVTIGVARKDIERDSYGIYEPRFRTMGAVAKQHPDELLSGVLLNGFQAEDYTETPFFSTNKPQDPGGRGTFTNKGTGQLGPNNFSAARAAIRSVKNSKGRPMGLGNKLLLVVSPDLETTARSILQADYIAQTAKNVAGNENIGVAAVSNVQKGTADLMVWPYLAAQPNYWFLLDVGWPIRPLIYQVEKETEFTSLVDPNSDHVFKNKEFLYQAYGRYNAGYGLPQLAWGSNGSTAAA